MRNSKHPPNPQTDTQRTRRAIRRRLAGTPVARVANEIREGDEWVFQTNTGCISRTIVGIDDERVYYRSYGDIYEKSCKAATFNRWLKGARLEFRRPDTFGVQEGS